MPAGLAKPSTIQTRTSLILDLKALSSERWTDFVCVYAPFIRYWIHRSKVPASSEKDVFQECLKSLFTSIEQFEKDPAKGRFQGWIRRIVERRAADFFRHNNEPQPVSPEVLVLVPDASQDEPIDVDVDRLAALRQVTARAHELVRQRVNEKTWTLFWQSAVEERPTAEIAREFGVSTAAVRVAKQRVLNRLRELAVDDLLGEP